MAFLIGDSHATEVFNAWSNELPNLQWKTALGFGLQNLVRDNRKPCDRNLLIKAFSSVPKGEVVIVSYTDVDGRMGEIETIEEDYQEAIALLFRLMQPARLIVVDWYSVSEVRQLEQLTSPEQRVKNRDAQLMALSKCKGIEVSTTRANPEYENENGFAKEGILRDGIHLDLSKEIHRLHLLPMMKGWERRNKQDEANGNQAE